MLFPTALSLLLFSSAAAAAALEERSKNPFGLPMLFVRQVNDPCLAQGQKGCGINCIDLTATCCPGGAGGCPASAYCALGDNGQYGCCPNGQICTGAGTAVITTNVNVAQPTGLVCPVGRKLCGVGCILNSESCCEGQGGCPRGQSCTLGDNSLYGCCSIGSSCTGDGGFFITSSEDIVLPSATRPPITASGTGELEEATAAATGAGGLTPAPTSESTLTPVEKKKKGSSIGAIVGGIVGGIAVIIIIALIIFFFVIKPRRKNKAGNVAQGPAPAAPAAAAAVVAPMGSYEPKPDHATLAGAGGATAASAYNQQQQHYQQPNRYSNATELASPASPQPYQNAQWGASAQTAQYPQGTQGYPQGTYPPQGGAYPYAQSPPPGAYVPQPGNYQQQQQQNYYQGGGYPAGSPANPLNAELPSQHAQQPQQPQAGPGYQSPGGYPQQGAQNPPTTTYAELPGSQR